jgi:hypothetical protein
MFNKPLKLSANQILATAKLLGIVMDNCEAEISKHSKTTKPFLIKLSRRFTAKRLSLYENNDLFKKPKTYHMTFDYNEAVMLFTILVNRIETVNDLASYNCLDMLKNDLHQSLT